MNKSFQQSYRRKALIKSLQYTKKLSPEKRFDLFLDLQQSLVSTYWTGLKSRYPELNAKQLLIEAKKEAENRVKKKQSIY